MKPSEIHEKVHLDSRVPIDYSLVERAAISSIGDIDGLLSLAGISRDVVARIVSDNLRNPLFLSEVERRPEQGVRLYRAIRWSMNERARRIFRAILSRILVKEGIRLYSAMRGKHRMRKVDYSPPMDFSLEDTLEKLVERSKSLDEISYEDIVGLERRDLRRSAVIIIDSSGSMTGRKMTLASVLAASVAYAVRFGDYAVIAFSDRAEILKSAGRRVRVEEVVEKILDLSPIGYTNMREALVVARRERDLMGDCRYVLITDGNYNVGGDPLEIAKNMRMLNVVRIERRRDDIGRINCMRIAEAGRGRVFELDNISRIPEILSNIFMN
ncbi:MAG: vWA domain-containing protein [Candidatus Methanodesulfokora washburnensis]|jgi:Mg-chelatase subunit ChlD